MLTVTERTTDKGETLFTAELFSEQGFFRKTEKVLGRVSVSHWSDKDRRGIWATVSVPKVEGDGFETVELFTGMKSVPLCALPRKSPKVMAEYVAKVRQHVPEVLDMLHASGPLPDLNAEGLTGPEREAAQKNRAEVVRAAAGLLRALVTGQ